MKDDNGNIVREIPSPDARLRVLMLANSPGVGYITDAQYGDIWPGPCLTWFGPEERFSTEEEAIAFCSENYDDGQ